MWHRLMEWEMPLPLKSKLPGKFQRFNVIGGSIEKN